MNTEGNEHSLEAYLRRQRTEVLEAILREDAEGWEEYAYAGPVVQAFRRSWCIDSGLVVHAFR